MSGSGFKYVQGEPSKKQKKLQKTAALKQAAEKELQAELVVQKQQEKLSELQKAQARFTAKANYRPKLPSAFNNSSGVENLIRKMDFSAADYVETTPDKRLRRALVHYVEQDGYPEDSDRYVGDFDCWIGGNAHFVDDIWIAGHAYMLGYKDFQIDTPSAAVTAIGALPDSHGAKPDIL